MVEIKTILYFTAPNPFPICILLSMIEAFNRASEQLSMTMTKPTHPFEC